MRTVEIINKIRVICKMGFEEDSNMLAYDFHYIVGDNVDSPRLFSFSLAPNKTTKNSSAKETYKEYVNYKDRLEYFKIDTDQIKVLFKTFPKIQIGKDFRSRLRVNHEKHDFEGCEVDVSINSDYEIKFTVLDSLSRP